jgi:predicted TIM-barrel fold metal-dependent hydrolase
VLVAKQGFRIMDSDMHVIEPHDLWLEYLEPCYRERAPQIAQVPDVGSYAWRCEGRFFPAHTDHPKRAALNRARYDQAQQSFRRYDAAMARRFDAKSQLEAMQVEGIDVAVTFRTIGSHVIAMDEIDPGFAAALWRAFNRWLAERCSEAPDRLKATAIVPAQDIGLAVAEAEYAVGELGHIALVLPSNPVAGRAWYDEAYDPLWRTACELGVPIAFHGIQAAYQEHVANRYLDDLMLMHAAAHPIELMLAMGALITGGVFDHFPDLRAAFLEGSCGWLPWWLWRLDEEHERLGHADRVSLRARPSEYFHRHCFVAVEPDEPVVVDVIERVGDDSLVISSDWPHDDSAYPHAMDRFLALEGVGDASRRKILWDNCARLYGLA